MKYLSQLSLPILIFLLFLTSGLHGYAQEASRFSNIGLEDGLSQMSVMKIYQDSKGFIWFGTRNGLNKYDGNTITVFKPDREGSDRSLVDRQITAITEDGDGNLWIGTGKGLSCLDTNSGHITSFPAADFPWLGSSVRSLMIDSRGNLWVGTQRGLYLFDPKTRSEKAITLNGELDNVSVTALNESADGRLLIGTVDKGLFVTDPAFKKLAHYREDSFVPGKSVADILVNKDNGNVWVATSDGGLSCLNHRTGTAKIYNKENSPLSTDNIRCLALNDGNLVVGTFDGLFSIETATGRLSRHSRAQKSQGTLSHFSIYSLCVDRSGGLWVGSYSGGADYYSRHNNRFVVHEPSIGESGNIAGVFGPITDTPDGKLYVATEGGGLLEYDKETGHSTRFLYDPSDSHNIIKSLLLEGDRIWCGTNNGTIYLFDRNSRRFSLAHTLPVSGSVYGIIRGHDGSLWTVVSKPSMGLIRVSTEGQMQTRFEIGDTIWRPGSGRCILEVSPGILLIGSSNNGLYRYDTIRKKYEVFDSNGKGARYLPANYVTSLTRDHKGRVWVGTFGGGISLYEDGKGIIKSITKADGLGDEDICMTVEDEFGRLWLSTSNNITSYDPESDEIHNYRIGSGTGAQEFTPHSGTLLSDGRIGFSTAKGFVTFSPSSMQLNTYRPPVVFTGLEVNNKEIRPEEGGILEKELDSTPRIELAYNQNNITISYAALNYVNPSHNTYAVRMIGYDDEWHDVGSRHSAYYTNLKPGKYTFEVKAANNDGIWNDDPRSLTIIVRSPIWATWYAWTLYAILFFGTIFLIGYYIVKKKALEQRVAYQRKEQERAEEFHRSKLQMFTNFSHELRTPLTLILSPLEELLHHTDFNHGVKNKLSLIYNNSQRMLILVNQLMDLRKSQSGKMKLKVSKEDMVSFMQEMYCAFNHLANGKDIHFEFRCDEERLPGWFDKSVCDKVLFNLLSNAFKFTRPGDSVVMSLDTTLPAATPEGRTDIEELKGSDHRLVHISVSDTGRGIPAEDLVRIFDPFYQVEEGQPKDASGTGIGLSLTKMIVALHHGVIWAENNPEGGAVFHVILPVDREAFSEDEFDKEAADRVVVDVIPSPAPETPGLDRRYTVLLAEDNEEVRNYVKECLLPYFDVIEADNGETAFDLAVEKYPDIIVSDVMMPRKDGLELCSQIKNDLRTEHIPVILMTARCMVMHIKEGFSSGADDYIVKPFSMDVLIYRMRNILVAREKLKKLYGKKFSLESLGIKIVSAEDKFTQKFFQVIEDNISNPDLNIDMICREVGLSRTNLYRKLKAITDLSPVELIRNKRLEVATRLLRESDYSVSEISTYVGFNSHAYFTQCFKSTYGCSPSEYVAKEKGESA